MSEQNINHHVKCFTIKRSTTEELDLAVDNLFNKLSNEGIDNDLDFLGIVSVSPVGIFTEVTQTPSGMTNPKGEQMMKTESKINFIITIVCRFISKSETQERNKKVN